MQGLFLYQHSEKFEIQNMKNLNQISTTLVMGLIYIASCTPEKASKVSTEDPLPSWNEGETKAAITTFVSEAI